MREARTPPKRKMAAGVATGRHWRFQLRPKPRLEPAPSIQSTSSRRSGALLAQASLLRVRANPFAVQRPFLERSRFKGLRLPAVNASSGAYLPFLRAALPKAACRFQFWQCPLPRSSSVSVRTPVPGHVLKVS